MKTVGERPQIEARKPSRTLMEHELQEAMAEAVFISPEALKGYKPPPICLRIVEEQMSGVVEHSQLLRALGLEEEEYFEVMKNPLNQAWVSMACHHQVSYMIGLADVSMWKKAVAGDVGAYKAILTRYGQNVQRSVHLRVDADGLDFESMSDEQLEKFAEQRSRELGIIDVSSREIEAPAEDRTDPSAGAPSETEEGSAASLLPTAPERPATVSRGGEAVSSPDDPDGEQVG